MSKKAAIVSVADRRHMSMITLYTNYMKEKRVEFDIICMNRYANQKTEQTASNVYQYDWPVENNVSKWKKLLPFFQFRRFAKKIIQEKKYDFLIIWNENTMVLLADLLLKRNYYKKYCINIRDYDFSKIKVLAWIRKKVIFSSAFTTVCVPKQYDALPANYDYTVVFSQNNEILKNCHKKERQQEKGTPIRISFIGKVRFLEEDKKIIQAFGNDKRYIIQFFGVGSENLEAFVKEGGYDNVILSGIFSPEQTGALLEQTDVMHVYYGKNMPVWEFFAPIKFGYAPYLHLPSLVTPDSYLADVVKKFENGYIVNDFEHLADDFYKWYYALDYSEFADRCERYCRYVDETNGKFYAQLEKYV